MSFTAEDVVSLARDETGIKLENAVGELFVPDHIIESGIGPIVRELNRMLGTTTAVREVNFTAVPETQDYTISTYVGTDVHRIDQVLRSGAFVPDGVVQTDEWDRENGYNGEAVIPTGLQADTFDVITAGERFRRSDRYTWETINGKLRLMPTPVSAETVSIRYTSTGYSVATLPDESKMALVYGACTVILNGVLNRLSSSRTTDKFFGETTDQRIDTLRSQRDEYRSKYQGELAGLRRG